MNAIDRAKADVQRGQHWMARHRLRSYLTAKGYEPDLLALMGRISHEMQDEFDAGRMWLLSNQTGPEVDQAIETFMRYAGETPKQIVDNLPKAVRLAVIEQYPQTIRERICRYGLEQAIVLAPKGKPDQRLVGFLGKIVAAVLICFGIGSFLVGAIWILVHVFSLIEWLAW